MIGRLVSFDGTAAAIADLERGLLDDCVGALRALPGLAGLNVLVNHGAGKAVVLAIWRDLATADAAMNAMVPLRRRIVGGGITQAIADYQVVV